MNRFISQKFRFYSFVSIAMLLWVHGYNLHETYLVPCSHVDEPLTLTTFTEYFFANGVLRFRIPLLFMISGYIYAMQDKRGYLEQIKTRFGTLMIPFFFWSALGLALTFFWQLFPVTAKAVALSHIDQLGDNRPYTEIGWKGMLLRWVLVPISFQLWFIRSLFIYNLMYPILRWLVLKVPLAWLTLAFFLWVTVWGFFLVEGTGLFFFSFGIWLYKRNYPLDKEPSWYSNYTAWMFFIGLAVIKTFMAFELDPSNPLHNWAMTILQSASIVSGIVAIWFGGDNLVRWFMRRKWFVWTSAFSFFIFGMHVPLLFYITNLAYIYLHNFPNYRLLTYIIVPLAVLLFCIALGALFRRLLPQVYRIATGGRGF